MQLRARLTPIGAALAAARTPTSDWRVLTEVEAVDSMRRLLERLDLKEFRQVRQGDGRSGPSWYEAPSLFIGQWAGSESAIVVKEDQDGPLELRFFVRTAADTIRTRYRIGDAPVSADLARAAWAIGIRKLVAIISENEPPRFLDKLRARGAILTARGDGWLEQVLMLTEPET